MKIRARSVGTIKIGEDRRIALDGANLQGADFSNRDLRYFGAIGSRLVDCRFDNVRIEDASFGAGRKMSEYIGCVFDGARMTPGTGGYYRFLRCSFRDVVIDEWFCFAVEIVDCTFSGRLRNSVFNGTVPERARRDAKRSRNEFRGNDFGGMEFKDVGFRTGIDLSLQVLPSGPDYLYLPEAESTLRRVREALSQVNGDVDAMARIVGFLEGELSGGQRQLLLRRSEYSRDMDESSLDTLFELLASNAS